MNGFLLPLLLAAVPTIVAITLHEAAHGYAALAMGDDTARRAGRLSLNPLVHVDRFGTILLPGFLLISQLLTIHRVAFMFGWAKPVPVSDWKFRDPRRGMMVVAAAGPAMNFLLAWLGALALYAAPYLGASLRDSFVLLIYYFLVANVALGLFNLLPIPPLDGGRIAVGLLPLPLARVWARMERAGILVVLLLLWVVPEASRALGHPIDPVRAVLSGVADPVLRAVVRLAGNPVYGMALLGEGDG